MPIIPVTKIITPPVTTFPAYFIQNHMSTLFAVNQDDNQKLPIFTVPENLLSTLQSNNDLLEIVAPSNGTLTDFRIFIVSNQTTKTFELDLTHGAFNTLVISGIDATANTLYTSSSISINVNKGDTLHYELKTDSNPLGGTVVGAFIMFTFKPTSST